MKATYGSLTKSGALQKNETLYINKDSFLCPTLFLFEENFYLMNSKQRSDGLNIELVSGAWSTVAVRRLIGIMRVRNYLEIVDSEFVRNSTDRLNADMHFYPLLKIICLTLSISLFRWAVDRASSRSEISQSIHSIFLFMEDRFTKSNHVSEADLPQSLHSETPIRLFRRKIRDVSLPHLLRIVSCNKIFCERTLFSCQVIEKNSIDTLFRNFYIYEIDLLLLISWKRISNSRVNYFLSIEHYNIFRKDRNVSICDFELGAAAGVDSYFNRRSCIHYGRYGSKFLTIFGGSRYFAKKWLYYFSTLFKHHFHHQPRFSQPCMELLSTSCISFLGYKPTLRPVPKNVRIETTMSLHIGILNEIKFHPRIPISTIIKILTKLKFCDGTGRPVGKSSWAVLTGGEILNRYVQLWQVFFLYYGASMNRDELRRLRYILQISCNRTLAGKHKSTIRLLQSTFDLEIRNQLLASSKYELSNSRRVWHLTLIWSVSVKFSVLERILQ
uniref:Maturase K n=1 Tax=Cryptogramma acrostichoides TaxID=414624 RepID=A0A3G5CS75_9MONI|nr:maturase K [Cryptogramma acrostichoides]AYW15706.1 maturase K [Cryptogramma acrostichoides]